MNPRTLALFFAVLLSGLSRLTAQSAVTSSTATPALILSFAGKTQDNNKARLDWSMENQTNCKWFVIERSGDTGGYDSIDVVTGINNGNHTEYSYTDLHMLKGNNYYRLRQVDMDGVVRYSKVVTLDIVAIAGKMAIYPNPAVALLNFSVSSPAAQQVTIQVYNLSGIVLLTSQQLLNAGNNQQSVAIAGLKSGNYFLKVSNRNGSSQYVQPFVKIM